MHERSKTSTAARVGVRAVVLVLFGAMFLQIVLGMRMLSATFDETTHLPSGYTYLRTGQFKLNPQHPPLVKLLSAAPLLLLDPALDLEDPGWTGEPPDEWGFGYRFLYHNDADRLLFWGRMPVALLAMLLAAYVYRWASALFGTPAGIAALGLCAFSPTLIAHARFVTFDVGLACFSTAALYHLWRHASGGGWRHLVAAGIGLGLTLASKFSGVLLAGPFLVLLAAAARRGPEAWRVRFGRLLLAVAAVLALALLVVEAVYFFPADPTVYVDGLLRVQADHDPDYAYFLMGEFRQDGWWYYFLAAFLFKTPLPTLIAIVLTVVLWRRLKTRTALDEWFLILPVLVYVAATSAMADNIGVRYLLPIYPLLFVFVSRLATTVAASRAARAVAVVLGLWYVAAALLIWPDQLAYFNELTGGPARGHRYLDDSNIDWGQDVKRLKRHVDREGIERIKLRLGPHAAPDHYGIPWQPLTDREWAGDPGPGFYALSTHVLIRGEHFARERGVKTDWLTRYEPIGRVGYSCYLFRFD